jgi:hypothetical protein
MSGLSAGHLCKPLWMLLYTKPLWVYQVRVLLAYYLHFVLIFMVKILDFLFCIFFC